MHYFNCVWAMISTFIWQVLPKGSRVVRAMPNTPSLVKEGASVFVCGSSATKDDALLTKKLFEAVGICEQVPEYLLDAVTGLSGSGPAYVSKNMHNYC